MSTDEVVVHGTINAEGALELDQKPPLAPGRVQVRLLPLPELPADDPFWQRMQAMWADQKRRGHAARTVEQVEAERQSMRDEWEQRMRRIEQIQAEAEEVRRRRREEP